MSLGDGVPVDPDLPPAEAEGKTRRDLRTLGAVALGGALGAPARYEVATIVHVAKTGFPWATFWTNVSGSFALGLFLIVVIERYPPSRYLRAFVATGFLGAFTTFSTFAVEGDLLVKNGRWPVALSYVVFSLALGLGAAVGGMTLGRRLGPGR